jgi:hypothetical protein
MSFSSECLNAKVGASGGVPDRAILLVVGSFAAEEAGRGEEDGLLSSQKGVKDDRVGCGVANEAALERVFSSSLPSDSLSESGGCSPLSSLSCSSALAELATTEVF